MKDLYGFKILKSKTKNCSIKLLTCVIKVWVKENYYPKGLGSSCYSFFVPPTL